MTSGSPLRYPGGKQVITPLITKLIALNGLQGKTYAEGYAGGAGAALNVLYSAYAQNIRLNDADPAIFSMWKSILDDSKKFIALLQQTPLTVDEWQRQKAIYAKASKDEALELGFATFYLNRVNRSGIIKNAGPIGGMAQTGKWKIDARFNRVTLTERIQRIARYRRRITVENLDAQDFVASLDPKQTFLYLDPPYYVKGKELYLNHYQQKDHAEVARFIQASDVQSWIITYDDVPEIRRLYRKQRQLTFQLSYSARSRKIGKEVLIAGESLRLPEQWRRSLPEWNAMN